MNPPSEIGSFEILEQLGAGGMGEVFRARDKRLNRFVAIKFLPASASATARERFQREALAIAALNHPNICTLHEAAEQYLVMELLEGETLFARLQRGPVPLPQMEQWGAEIADALQAAHAKGILHRDLKPGNIFITERGTVKVLDFGLAQFGLAAAASDTEAPTITTPAAHLGPLTTPGTTMGTYAYMSPEQARGEATDTRSDIFSLGVVLYEMASGKAPFQGRTTADLTAQILMLAPPAPSALRADIPPRLDDIIAQCLEKDPNNRFQSAADLRVTLRRLLAPSSSAGAAAAAVARAPARRRWLWPVVAALVIAGGAAWWKLRAPAGPPVLSFRTLTYSGHVHDAVLSPDGKFLAHVDQTPQGTSLRLLSIASGGDIEIAPPGAGCCDAPTFSPDGSHVYYLQGSDIKTISVLGGAARTIAGRACSGAGFSPDGSRIAFESDHGQSLVLARPDGSHARTLRTAARQSYYLGSCWIATFIAPVPTPAWSPDGRWIALVAQPASGSGHIELVNASTGQEHPLGPGENLTVGDLAWLPSGKGLVFVDSIPLGTPPQVWEMTYPGGHLVKITNDLQGYGGVHLAANGAMVLLHSAPQSSVWVQKAAGSGEFAQLAGGGADLEGADGLAWTPQGDLILTRTIGGKDQIWRENSDGSDARQLPMPGAPALLEPRFVAPGGEIIFEAANGEGQGVWRARGDGTGLVKLSPGPNNISPVLIHDGREVVYTHVGSDETQTLWTVPLDGGAARQLWSGFVAAGGNPVSPDGSTLFVFTRNAAGGRAAVLLHLTATGVKVSPAPFDPDAEPYGRAWMPDGRAIVYIQRQGSMENLWAYPLHAGQSHALTHFGDLMIAGYAFARDGRLAVSRLAPNSDAILATGLEKRP